MRKRSRSVALALVGAAAFTLSACREEESDVTSFPDLASCKAQADAGSLAFTAEDCAEAFAQAEADHLATAPRYDSQQVCEEQHGVGNCGTDAVQQPGGGFSFLPLIAGYMIGSMMSGGRGFASQPLVNTANGRFATPGGTSITTNNGAGKLNAAAFNKAPTTVGKPPMSRADVASRGGFGATSAARTGTSGG
ncbi:DUF1190 domain-containing protein [Cereibacter sp. SYSU M97828]|nr:DUF1190 domain-containing protein [Cereibacter flavus]